MTIAAGFCFRDGILLCADTEQTLGDFKFGESKIVSERLPTANVAFAISGSVHNAHMAIEEILKDSKKSDQSQDAFEEIIKNRIADIYTRLLYPHPAASYGTPFFDLLIAIWAEGNLRLLATSETAVTEVATYDCRGIGLTLAKYLIKPLYNENMTRRSIELVATRTLAHVKEYVSGCGGRSEFVTVDALGEMQTRIIPEHSLEADLISSLDDIFAGMFFTSANIEMPDTEVVATLGLFQEFILEERQKIRERVEKIKRLAQKL